MNSVRTAPRAVIIEDGKLLTVVMKKENGDLFHVLPGGGQHWGETLPEGLKRECAEELGAEIEVGEVIYVREYIGKNHDFSKRHVGFHQLEVVFRCRLPEGSCVSDQAEGDTFQVGTAWVPLADLANIEFYPPQLAEHVFENELKVSPIYLGDIN